MSIPSIIVKCDKAGCNEVYVPSYPLNLGANGMVSLPKGWMTTMHEPENPNGRVTHTCQKCMSQRGSAP